MIDPAALFGTTHRVTIGQECARAVVIVLYGVTLIRVAGRRIFGKRTALDVIVSVVVGSSLSRALTGSAPLAGTLVAMVLVVVLHGLLGKLLARSSAFSHLLEGRPIVIARDGAVIEEARTGASLSEADVAETLRQHNLAELPATGEIVLEPSGRLSVLRKQD